MLVLIGPPFAGSDDEYGRLAQVTGLLPYELRTKLKPGAWGVVKAIAAESLAADLAERLRGQGFRVAVVDPAVAADPGRLFVPLTALEIHDDGLVLHLTERSMPVPFKALLTVVRGEVQLGARQRSRPESSSTFRAVVPEAALESATPQPIDAFAAADLHFATVLWAARVDARSFDFSVLGRSGGGAQDLDRLVDLIAERAQVRVDRASRVSSVASFTAGPARVATPLPGAAPGVRREIPERFDAYSRLVAEAERQSQRHARLSTRPPAPG